MSRRKLFFITINTLFTIIGNHEDPSPQTTANMSETMRDGATVSLTKLNDAVSYDLE